MDDNRVLVLDYTHARACELFSMVSSRDVPLEDIGCDEYKAVLYPVEGLEVIPNSLALRYVAAERADILLAAICIQFELASKGDERVKHIEANKDDLLTLIGEEEIKKALDLDIAQQSFDMAIMTTMSHSALLFAERYAKGDVEKLVQYRDKVFDMISRYKHNSDHFKIGASSDFKGNAEAMESFRLQAENLTPYVVSDPVGTYFRDTTEIYELNVMLAQMCESRFENGIRSLYFWRKEFGDIPQTESTGCEVYDKFCVQKSDWEYEVEIQDVVSQRVDILSARSKKIGDLLESVCPYMG